MKNYFDLTGKTVLITGASRGLGARFSKVLLDHGCKIIAAARNENYLKNFCERLDPTKKMIRPLVMDVSQLSSIEVALKTIETNNEKVDILINNACTALRTPIDKPHVEEWQEHMNLNLLGPWLLIQNLTQHMIKHSIHGSIINISSVNGDQVPCSTAASYCATKAGMMQMTKQLVGELSPHNIRINCILPGFFHTDMTKERIEQNRKKYEDIIPLNFIAEPEDMDATILFLSSNKASRYMTGSCLTIDGGMSTNCRIV